MELLVVVNKHQTQRNDAHCANIPVSVSSRRTLNKSRGVMPEPDLLHVSENEIVEILKEQNAIEA